MVVALSRAGRPHDTAAPAERRSELPAPADGPVPGCPFCEGAEAQTPPETWALRPGGGARDTPGWRVRAFPNKFPALPAGEGEHEVVVSSPRHVVAFWDLTDDEAADALDGWAARVAAVGTDPRQLWPFAFLNQGAPAGASLQHSHAQVVGLPFAPGRLVARERAFVRADRCPVCHELETAGERVVLERDGLVAWCPQAPPLSGGVRIAPAEHRPRWGMRPGAAAGPVLRRLMRAASDALGTSAANVWLHQARPSGPDAFHWHLEIVPRLGTLAGMELGAGVLAVTRDPLEVAARLRAALGAAASVPQGAVE
jgi:UDPglucose--hexose-1-phosphate uridylyltransferase